MGFMPHRYWSACSFTTIDFHLSWTVSPKEVILNKVKENQLGNKVPGSTGFQFWFHEKSQNKHWSLLYHIIYMRHVICLKVVNQVKIKILRKRPRNNFWSYKNRINLYPRFSVFRKSSRAFINFSETIFGIGRKKLDLT